MKTNSLCLLFVGALLGAGLSLARPPKPPAPPPEPAVTEAPQTCEEQCELLTQSCSDPCKKIKKGKEAKAACSANCDQIAMACAGSCKKLGRLDGQYILEHIRPPKMPAGARQQGGGEE